MTNVPPGNPRSPSRREFVKVHVPPSGHEPAAPPLLLALLPEVWSFLLRRLMHPRIRVTRSDPVPLDAPSVALPGPPSAAGRTGLVRRDSPTLTRAGRRGRRTTPRADVAGRGRSEEDAGGRWSCRQGACDPW